MAAESLAGYFWSFCITLVTVPILKIIAFKYAILDAPDGKLKIHTKITPYLGGVAVFLGFSTYLYFLSPCSANDIFLFSGLFLLVCVGFYDDVWLLSPFQKIVGQFVACCFFLASGCFFNPLLITTLVPFLENYSLLLYGLSYILSLWWMLSIINAFNLIDIMDGLATMVAFIAAVFFLKLACFEGMGNLSCLLLAFSGSLGAFWLYNAPPASIYLGDCGSLLLGGVLAAVPFKLSCWHSGTSLKAFFVPIFILIVPILELCIVISIRFYKKLPVYYGSPHHFISYLKRKGWPVVKILFFTGIVAILWGSVALMIALFNLSLPTLFTLVAFLFFLWVLLIYF